MPRLVLLALALLVLGGLFLALRPGAPSDAPQARTIELTVRDGTMAPADITVREGDRVTFTITSDRPVALHVHGYDLEQDVRPGESATLTFEATLTGRFEIEDEQTERTLGTLVVQPREGG